MHGAVFDEAEEYHLILPHYLTTT